MIWLIEQLTAVLISSSQKSMPCRTAVFGRENGFMTMYILRYFDLSLPDFVERELEINRIIWDDI